MIEGGRERGHHGLITLGASFTRPSISLLDRRSSRAAAAESKGAGCASWSSPTSTPTGRRWRRSTSPTTSPSASATWSITGPNPVECVRWAMEHARYSIRGNHDHGVAQGVSVARRDRLSLPDPRHPPLDVGGARGRGAALPAPTAADLAVHDRQPAVPAGPRHAPRPARRIPDARTPRPGPSGSQDCEADIVCVGHSHMQFNLRAGDGRRDQPRERRQPSRRRPSRGLRRHRRTTRSSSSGSTTRSRRPSPGSTPAPCPTRPRRCSASATGLADSPAR